MKYTEDKATGDAGEYLFAYRVSNLLQWPCRLLDIDIGIDAQIEVLDENRQSMGQFIAVQIKATRDKDKNSISVDNKHIKYWESLDTPVVLVFVNLSNEKVYARPFEDFKGGQTLHFSIEHELTVKMKKEFRLLAYSKTIKENEVKLDKIKKEIDNILYDLTNDRVQEIEEYDYYIDFMYLFKRIELSLHSIKNSLGPIHSIVGDCNYGAVLKIYMEARMSYIEFLHAWSFHIHDHDEVKLFKKEYVGLNSYLEL